MTWREGRNGVIRFLGDPMVESGEVFFINECLSSAFDK